MSSLATSASSGLRSSHERGGGEPRSHGGLPSVSLRDKEERGMEVAAATGATTGVWQALPCQLKPDDRIFVFLKQTTPDENSNTTLSIKSSPGSGGINYD